MGVGNSEMAAHRGQIAGHALGFAALDAALAGGADGQAGDRTVERQANASEPAAETAADVKEAEMQPCDGTVRVTLFNPDPCAFRAAARRRPTVPTFKHTSALLE